MPFETNTILGIVAALFGGLNIFQFFAFKAQIQKERALAGQETGKSKQENAKGLQEEVTALNSFSDLYDKIAKQFNAEFDKMKERMDTMDEELKAYIKQCSTCENNKIGKKN